MIIRQEFKLIPNNFYVCSKSVKIYDAVESFRGIEISPYEPFFFLEEIFDSDNLTVHLLVLSKNKMGFIFIGTKKSNELANYHLYE